MHWRVDESGWQVLAGPFDRQNYNAAKEESVKITAEKAAEGKEAGMMDESSAVQPAEAKATHESKEVEEGEATNTADAVEEVNQEQGTDSAAENRTAPGDVVTQPAAEEAAAPAAEEAAAPAAEEGAAPAAEEDAAQEPQEQQGVQEVQEVEESRLQKLTASFEPSIERAGEGEAERAAHTAEATRRMAALVKVQAYGRRIAVRALQVQIMHKKGIMAAMPGTIQNKSGWYEYMKDGKTMAVHWRVDDDGAWHLLSGPVDKRLWTVSQQKEEGAAVAIQAKLRQRKAVQGVASKRVDIVFMGIVGKMQAMVRSRLARARVVQLMSTKGGCAAMPGTVQGRSGFYEYMQGMDARIAQFGVTETGGWKLLEGPWSRAEWAERRDNNVTAPGAEPGLTEAATSN
jgi:hypothetical protein